MLLRANLTSAFHFIVVSPNFRFPCYFLTDLQDEDLHSESRDCASEYTVDDSEGPTKAISSEDDITSGEFVLRTLFAEFTILAEKKIELVLAEPLVSSKNNVLDW